MTIDHRPLIITAQFAAPVQARFEALRRAHYPAARNLVPAHVTMFQQLPGSCADEVRRRIKAVCGDHPPPPVTLAGFVAQGEGVAVRLLSPALAAVRCDLADGLAGLLTAADAGGFAPHLTVQNKVSAAVARATLALLATERLPPASHFVALALWRYCDGLWLDLGETGFRGR